MDLRAYLKQHDLTLAEFGQRVGLSHSHLSRIARRQSRPSAEKARKIETETCGAVLLRDLMEEQTA